MKVNIAIVGATGLVGRTFLTVLEEYGIDIDTLKVFASERSKGKTVLFKDKEYKVDVITKGSFVGIDYALFSAGASTAKQYARQAAEEGAIVIDNSSAFRMDPTIPLVVPEVNIEDAIGAQIIANPNCSTIQCMLPLKIIQDSYGIESIEYNTYQAVSGSGQQGIDDLENTKKGEENSFYPYDISKTCIPQIDVFLEDGYTKEEHKMMNESRKILHNDAIKISATCVRVPVAHSHAVSIRVTLNDTPTLEEVRHLFMNVNGLVLLDVPEHLVYPLSTVSNGTDDIYIGRIRKDKINPKTFLLYVVADNIRKGAASNAIQIMLGVMNHEGR
jgi:aspartate-semialdehyde dehydrogenase